MQLLVQAIASLKHESIFNFEKDLESVWTTPMARGKFRLTSENDLVFNIFLPDKIYDWENNRKLGDFT